MPKKLSVGYQDVVHVCVFRERHQGTEGAGEPALRLGLIEHGLGVVPKCHCRWRLVRVWRCVCGCGRAGGGVEVGECGGCGRAGVGSAAGMRITDHSVSHSVSPATTVQVVIRGPGGDTSQPLGQAQRLPENSMLGKENLPKPDGARQGGRVRQVRRPEQRYRGCATGCVTGSPPGCGLRPTPAAAGHLLCPVLPARCCLDLGDHMDVHALHEAKCRSSTPS